MRAEDSSRPENEALKALILERITAEGSISFADFLRLALYHPLHGYYLSQDPARDYQSSPNLHPIFGEMLARQLAALWRTLGRPDRFDVFEAAAGNGKLAAAILRGLRQEEPELYHKVRYVLQDPSYSGAEPRRLLAAAGLPRDRIEITTAPPAPGSIEGCILANELLDALPFHRVRLRDGRLVEVRVAAEAGRLVDVEAPPSGDLVSYFAALGRLPGEGSDAEVNLETPRWLAAAAAALRRGYLLLLDYGYEAENLYAPWRRQGTLLTFYRHTAGSDPYIRIGRQDITASVDFTTLRRAGESAGLVTQAFMTQQELLAALGIGESLARGPSPGGLDSFYALRRAVLELTDSSGLGRIRALIQARDVPVDVQPGV